MNSRGVHSAHTFLTAGLAGFLPAAATVVVLVGGEELVEAVAEAAAFGLPDFPITSAFSQHSFICRW